MIDTLVTDLQNLFEYLDKSFSINCGGCCYVAYLIAKNLEKRNINNFSLKIYYDKYLDDFEEEKCLNNILNNTGQFPTGDNVGAHYVIELNNELLNDCDYAFDINYKSIELNIDASSILKIYNYGVWNDDFNTSLKIIIEKFINVIFTKYDKNL